MRLWFVGVILGAGAVWFYYHLMAEAHLYRRVSPADTAACLDELHTLLACPRCRLFERHMVGCDHATETYPGGVYRAVEAVITHRIDARAVQSSDTLAQV